ncbi:MAG: hypothetical protein ACI9D5_002446 [Candidatus Endobugula sp.]|jgi:hypothetical protein
MIKYLYILSFIFISSCASGPASLSQPPSTVEILEAKKANSPVAVSGIHGVRNSANGVDIQITYKNISDRIIKYVTFHVQFKNAVNDVVAGEISGQKITSLRATGPIKPNAVRWGAYNGWSAAFYHSNAKSVHISKVEVEYVNEKSKEKVVVIGLPGTFGVIAGKR